mmetsp:Transcript_4170/g.6640  ORF Transcript_4170/g.6640 Transcript_4170/m.6640 type:complete len:216 (+) Transcript_4170:2334-2981(+)
MVLGWFRRKHIQCGSCHLTALQTLQQRRFVDNPTPGTIDNPHTRFTGIHTGLIKNIRCLWGQRSMHRDEIALGPDIGQLHAREPGLFESGRRHHRVIANHMHPHCVCHGCYVLANASTANNAQGFAGDLHTRKGFSVPFSLFYGHIRSGDRSGQRAEEGHGELGSADGVSARRIHHHDTCFGGLGDVDVVDPYSSSADDAHFLRRLNHSWRDLGG